MDHGWRHPGGPLSRYPPCGSGQSFLSVTMLTSRATTVGRHEEVCESGAPMEGIDEAKVTAWMEANTPPIQAPLDFELIAGGRSNLTYRVTDATGRNVVLRRPPVSHVLASAHDMGREHKIISALQGSPVPVPV